VIAPSTPIGLADDQRVADLLFPGDLFHQFRHRRERRDRQPGLDPARELQRHPQLRRDRCGDLVGALVEAGGDRAQKLGPLFLVGLRPALEGVAGGTDRAVDILRRRLGDRSDRLLGGRIDHLDPFRTLGIDPFATDEEIVANVLLGCRGQWSS